MTFHKNVTDLMDCVYAYLKDQGSYREMFNSDFTKGRLPEASLEKLNEAHEFSEKIRSRVEKEQKENQELSHYDEMMLKTLLYYCDANFFLSGCENPAYPEYADLNSTIAPNNSPLYFVNSIAEIDTAASEENSRKYQKLIKEYPRLAKDCLERTKHQIKNGIYLPEDTLKYTISALRSLCAEGNENCLYLTEDRVYRGIEDRRKFAEESNQSLFGAICILKKILALIDMEEYRKRASKEPGLCQYPGGKEYYRKLVKFHCGTDVTWDELYEFAVKHLEKLDRQMEEIIRDLGYDCSRKEFFNETVKTMPELFDHNEQEVNARYTRYLDRIRLKLPDFFEKLPKADCRVEPLPKGNEASTGLFAAPTPDHPEGRYLYSAENIEKQNQIFAGSLIYHELLPGHHFQMSLQLENESLHPLIRSLYYLTGYGEGWADYASFLAEEMGMYENPLDRLGRLYNEMRHTIQIPIDVGVNAYGWSYEKAFQFYRDYTGAAEEKAAAEISRFGNDIQGQGLSYTYGACFFDRLRKDAELRLGKRFDLKEFNSMLLELGAIPLSVLKEHEEWYIQKKLGEEEI